MIDELVVGNSGLLNELELRGGLSCECLSQAERQANYYNAVKAKVDSDKSSIISDSFLADEYGVASELLRWRDELLVAGWNSDIRHISAKLDFISDVERLAMRSAINIKGESDRWKAVLNSNSMILNKGDEIIIHYPERHLPPFISGLLKKLSGDGIKCTFKFPDKSIAPEGTNLQKVQEALLMNIQGNLDIVNDKSLRVVKFD